MHGDGTHADVSAAALPELAQFAADGQLEIRIAQMFKLDQVQDAFRLLAERHTRGKIVRLP